MIHDTHRQHSKVGIGKAFGWSRWSDQSWFVLLLIHPVVFCQGRHFCAQTGLEYLENFYIIRLRVNK